MRPNKTKKHSESDGGTNFGVTFAAFCATEPDVIVGATKYSSWILSSPPLPIIPAPGMRNNRSRMCTIWSNGGLSDLQITVQQKLYRIAFGCSLRTEVRGKGQRNFSSLE